MLGTKGLDPSAVAFLARLSVAPTPARKALYNSLFVSLRASGILALLDALYLTAAADAQAAGLNLVQNSFNLTGVNAPTFTADRGYAGDGSTSYLNTNWAPSNGVQFTQNSASFGVYVNINAQNAAADMGTGSLLNTYVGARDAGNHIGYRVNATSTFPTVSSVTTSVGLTAAQRSDSSNLFAFKNGLQVGTSAVASSAPSAIQFNIGRVSAGFNSDQIAAAYMGAGLTSAQHLSLYNAIFAYLSAIGAA